jgi:hypothetical protein
MYFYETSAKLNKNLDEAFKKAAELIVHYDTMD